MVEWISQLVSNAVVAAVVASLLTLLVNWILEGRKFKREQRLSHLRERIDKFYSPLIFHFENMKSWGVFLGSPNQYAYSGQELRNKLCDMYQIMRTGLKFASPKAEAPWYEWQPMAIASVELLEATNVYPQFNTEEFLKRSRKLHEALRADREEIMRQYKREIGVKEE